MNETNSYDWTEAANKRVAALEAENRKLREALKIARFWVFYSDESYELFLNGKGPSVEKFQADCVVIEAALASVPGDGKAEAGKPCQTCDGSGEIRVKCRNGDACAMKKEPHFMRCPDCVAEAGEKI